MKKFLNWFTQEESGQGMVEYGLIIALIAVVLIGAITLLSGGIGDVFNKAASTLTSATN